MDLATWLKIHLKLLSQAMLKIFQDFKIYPERKYNTYSSTCNPRFQLFLVFFHKLEIVTSEEKYSKKSDLIEALYVKLKQTHPMSKIRIIPRPIPKQNNNPILVKDNMMATFLFCKIVHTA